MACIEWPAWTLLNKRTTLVVWAGAGIRGFGKCMSQWPPLRTFSIKRMSQTQGLSLFNEFGWIWANRIIQWLAEQEVPAITDRGTVSELVELRLSHWDTNAGHWYSFIINWLYSISFLTHAQSKGRKESRGKSRISIVHWTDMGSDNLCTVMFIHTCVGRRYWSTVLKVLKKIIESKAIVK